MIMIRNLFAAAVLLPPLLAIAHPAPQNAFDFFIFALQWPGTICSTRSSCCQHLSSATGFTIHGIWPEFNDGSWPQCCSGPAFDDSKISSLSSKLQSFWPSLYCGSSKGCHGTEVSFWGHEWEKHGTCAWPVVHNEYDYFATALKLYEENDLLAVLMKAGIVPLIDEHYNASSLVSAVAEAFGASPVLICSNGRLKEIRLCFTKDFQSRDCIDIAIVHTELGSASNSCPQQLLIPPLVSLKKFNSRVNCSRGQMTNIN